jgi:hypothetical protein
VDFVVAATPALLAEMHPGNAAATPKARAQRTRQVQRTRR